MTVCIAAICVFNNQAMILGASDRMITAGDIEFEPPQTKIYCLAPHIVALIAGSSQAQITISRNTFLVLQKQPAFSVTEAAEVYRNQFVTYRRQEAEQLFLAPLGLDIPTFLDRQRDMAPGLVTQLTKNLHEYELNAQTIIAGIDGNGAHIYVVSNPGHLGCNDSVGFAATGYGQWHAESQFMFNGYTARDPLERALFITYSAKKRAEVAPGVGTATDMFFIGPNGYSLLDQKTMEELQTIHATTIESEAAAIQGAHQKVQKYLSALIAQPIPIVKEDTPQAEKLAEDCNDKQREEANQIKSSIE